MKTISLIRLSLKDFQGGTGTITADGKDININGANGKGKTRIASAFSWILFDKDSLGRSDFEIKNLDAHGNEEHGLEHSVEAVLEIEGVNYAPFEVTLKKTYREQWTKKRGSATATFTGHTVDYHIDGVPCQKKDFQSRIAEIVGTEETFRLLTSPTAFPALHWQKQRSLLLEICGDISDADVIASEPKLQPLTGILGKRTLDDHKKVITARRTEINKDLEKIPVRIDECKRSMPDITGLDWNDSVAAVVTLEERLSISKERLSGIDNGSGISELSKKLAVVNADLQKVESNHYTATMKDGQKLGQEITEITDKISSQQRRLQGIDGEISQKKPQVVRIDGELETARARWTEVEAETFTDTTESACPTCHQPLPGDLVQAARDKALSAFNVSKSDRLTDIEGRGTRLAEEKARLTAEIEALATERIAISDALPEQEAALLDLTVKRDNIRKTAEDYSLIFGRDTLLTVKADIEADIQAAKNGQSQDTEKIKADIAALQAELTAAKEKVDRFTKRESGEKRIHELMAEEKTLAAEYETLEEQLFLCELFVRTKVNLLTDRINGKFEVVRFKLFSEQVNGGLAECCEITVNGVPFGGGLNNAAKIQAGCDVIRTLQQHYGLQAPVIVDNRESVTDLPDMGCQVISLIVSPEDRTLRIVTEAEQRQVVAA